MTKEAEIVLAGFAKLSETDRQEVADSIDKYRRSDGPTKRLTGESWEKRGRDRVLMGPVSASCPCCGR